MPPAGNRGSNSVDLGLPVVLVPDCLWVPLALPVLCGSLSLLVADALLDLDSPVLSGSCSRDEEAACVSRAEEEGSESECSRSMTLARVRQIRALLTVVLSSVEDILHIAQRVDAVEHVGPGGRNGREGDEACKELGWPHGRYRELDVGCCWRAPKQWSSGRLVMRRSEQWVRCGRAVGMLFLWGGMSTRAKGRLGGCVRQLLNPQNERLARRRCSGRPERREGLG